MFTLLPLKLSIKNALFEKILICHFLQSLEKAKEAGRKERALVRQREQTGTADHINLDLTYSVSST